MGAMGVIRVSERLINVRIKLRLWEKKKKKKIQLDVSFADR